MVSDFLTLIGLVLIFIGFALVVISVFLKAKNAKTEFGFVGFIGPIPIAFGTSKEIILIGLMLGLIIFLTTLLFLGRPW